MKAIEDKNAAIESKDGTFQSRIDEVEKKLDGHIDEETVARREAMSEVEGVEMRPRNKMNAREEFVGEEDRAVKEKEWTDKLDSLGSRMTETEARSGRFIFMLYTALTEQVCRQQQLDERLRCLADNLTEFKNDVKSSKSTESTRPLINVDEVRQLLDIAHTTGNNPNRDDRPLNSIRRKDDAGDAVVLARRIDALEAQRNEDTALINTLRQRLFDTEHLTAMLKHERSQTNGAQTEDGPLKSSTSTPLSEVPLSQRTTEIEETPTSVVSPHAASYSSPLEGYDIQHSNDKDGASTKKYARVIKPQTDARAIRTSLRGTMGKEQLKPAKTQPNATRKRKALAPAAPLIARQTRSKAKVASIALQQKINSTMVQAEKSKALDSQCLVPRSSEAINNVESRESIQQEQQEQQQQQQQQQNKKRRQIIQYCELEEPD